MTEKRFHPFAVLHLLRKTILVYLLPLVQVLFARNWAALWAALAQDVLLLALLSMVCWEVLRVSGWQMDAHGNLLVRWRLGIRLDRTLRADMLAALTIDRPVVYRLAGASRLTLYPAGQKKPLTLIVARDDARELADRLLPLEQPVVHRPHGGEKMVFAVLGANGLSTLALLALALRQSRPYAPDAQTLAFAHLSHLAAFAARWLPMGTAWMLVATGWLFCISLVRSAAQVAHYTVWRTAAQLGSRGGLLHRYEMRLCRAHLNYADLRRSPVTRALHYCPVFVTAGSCAPELPLFVWKEGTPLLQELLPGIALPPDTAEDIYRILLTGERGAEALDLEGLTRALAPRFYGLTLRDRTRVQRAVWDRMEEDTLTGLFLRLMAARCRAEPENEILQQAVRFGLAALENGEDVAP